MAETKDKKGMEKSRPEVSSDARGDERARTNYRLDMSM